MTSESTRNRLYFNFDTFDKTVTPMSRISDSIKTRKFTGSSVPAGSELVRRLLNSSDSRKIIAAIRANVKDKPQTVKLSKETMESLREPQ